MKRLLALSTALFLLTTAFATAAVTPSDLDWIAKIPGVRLTAANDTPDSLLRTYRVSSPEVMGRVQAELEQRGWRVRSRASMSTERAALTATRDDLSMSVSMAPGRTMSVSVTVKAPPVNGAGSEYTAPTLNVSKTTRTLTLRGPLTLNGSDNLLTLQGTCSDLVINGSGNKIVGPCRFGRITFNGRGNTLRWAAGANPKPPAVTDNGRKNSASGQK